MTSYIFKLLNLIFFSSFIIYFYYFSFTFHQESYTGYSFYLLSILIFYFLYKILSLLFLGKKLRFSPFSIFLLFCFHLFILCINFFDIYSFDLIYSFTLFFKILSFGFLPFLIIIISLSFGSKILSFIKGFNLETSTFRFLSSLGIGFFSFMIILSILGFFGFYNLYSVFSILLIFSLLSYDKLFSFLKSIFTYKFEIENHDFTGSDFFKYLNFRLLSTEFLFIVITFLLSINLINIVRPMPIGWDDLGYYMNIAQTMAISGDVANIGSMLSWQLFTGIGYMFHSATQAFFINNVGGFLSIIVLILAINDLLKTRKNTFINISFLVGAVFLSMPMIIFQQAKDMKLDPGLFFVSVIALYMLLYVFIKYIGYKKETLYITNDSGEILDRDKNENIKTQTSIFDSDDGESKKFSFSFIKYKFNNLGNLDLFSNKTYLIYIFIIGILSGFAFSIKLTSLMLISAFIGVIFYAKLGFSGFLGYISLFFGIFTKFGLWSYMNVVYPKDDKDLINNFFIFSLLVSICFFVYTFYKYSFKSLKKTFVLLFIYLFGVLFALSPWLTKHYIELDNVSLGGLMHGQARYFEKDYTLLYSEDELQKIESNYENSDGISDSGTTKNEDWGRYFGYEDGINNYLKLPWNLTMQVNQRGEFTDITYFFLAFIPVIFLFLSYKRSYFAYFIIPLLFLEFLVFYSSGNPNDFITKTFSEFSLPGGYIIISLFFLIPFLFFIYSLSKDRLSQLFRLNLVFTIFYVFLWTLAAFGVVWYGILMYFSLFLMFSISLHYISSYSDDIDLGKKIIKFISSILVFGLVSIYFFSSTYPHGFENLKKSNYPEYKAGLISQSHGIFASHPEYLEIIFELNIAKDKREDFFDDIISKINKDRNVKYLVPGTKDNLLSLLSQNKSILGFESVFKTYDRTDVSKLPKEHLVLYKNDLEEVKKSREYMYDNILYPKSEYKSEDIVFRIGTFLKYFINSDNTRLIDDSLIIDFDKYIFTGDIDSSVENMKKLGVSYLLSDLNAATIDKDPRRDLTRRNENLFRTFRSDKLEIISSDSLCLKTSLESYKKGLFENPIDKHKKYIDNLYKSNISTYPKGYNYYPDLMYMSVAGVNYETYTHDGSVIDRNAKKSFCYDYILSLYSQNKIDNANFSYLSGVKNVLDAKKFQSQEELVAFLSRNIRHGWMVLFKIK